MSNTIKAVLFDADGVLVDACELHYVALNKALATMGWNISRSEHENTFNGLPTQRKLEILTERHAFPRDWHETVHELKQRYTWDAIDALQPDLSKRELLAALRSEGIRIAVCSNAIKKSLLKMLEAIGISHLADLTLGNDDVMYPKPNPEIYITAARRLGVPVSECVIVEDSAVGLKAAYAAHPLDVIQVASPLEVNIALMPRILRGAQREVA